MAQRSHGVRLCPFGGIDKNDVVHVEPQLGKGLEESEVHPSDMGVAGDELVGHLIDDGCEARRREDEPAGNEDNQQNETDERRKGDAGYLKRFLHFSLPYRICTSW